MSGKKVIIVGAGPGGLTCAMILARRGFSVTVYDKEDRVGGRNAALKIGPYTFDTGPHVPDDEIHPGRDVLGGGKRHREIP